MPQKPAPGELRIVQALINTAPVGKRIDALADPGALAAWLERWGLVAAGTDVDGADLEKIREVRTALRALIAANRAGDSPQDAFEVLDQVASSVSLRVRFLGGDVALLPGTEGFHGALARIFAMVVQARYAGAWRRLRLCLDESCGSAFFDRNENEYTRWCTPHCRMRQASRAYRQRRKHRGE